MSIISNTIYVFVSQMTKSSRVPLADASSRRRLCGLGLEDDAGVGRHAPPELVSRTPSSGKGFV